MDISMRFVSILELDDPLRPHIEIPQHFALLIGIEVQTLIFLIAQRNEIMFNTNFGESDNIPGVGDLPA